MSCIGWIFWKMSSFTPGIISLFRLNINVVAPKAPALIAASRCSTPYFMEVAALRMRTAMLNGPTVRGLLGISTSSLILDLKFVNIFCPKLERVIPALETLTSFHFLDV